MRGYGSNCMALVSPSELAKRLGFSTSQIRRLIREGLIKAKKIGNFYAIDEKDIKNIKRRRSIKS